MTCGDSKSASKLSGGELWPLPALALSPPIEPNLFVVIGRSDSRLVDARGFDEGNWPADLAEPLTVPNVDCRDDRLWSGTLGGGAMKVRCALAIVVRPCGITAGAISRVVPPEGWLEFDCFVGDLLGD